MTKRLFILITVALLYALPVISQTEVLDRAKSNLQGKVKSVKQFIVLDKNDTARVSTFYEYNEDGTEKGHKYYDYKEPPTRWYENKYTEKGKISEIIMYRYLYGLPILESREKYTYDDHDNEIEFAMYDGEDSIADYHTVTNYDSLHHIVSSYTTNSLGDTTSMKLFEHGNMVKKVKYLTVVHTVMKTSEYKYKYDGQGRIISEENHTSDGESPLYTVYAYDERGYKVREEFDHIKKDSTDGPGKHYNPVILIFKRDEYGNLINILDNVGGHQLSAHRYEYDKQGNWIKKYSVNEERLEEKREIEYYH